MHRFGILFISMILAASASLVLAEGWQDKAEKADKARAAAEESARRAGVARDLGLNAARNVTALRDDAEASLVAALRLGDKAAIKGCRKSLDALNGKVEGVWASVTDISGFAVQAASAAAMARNEALKASQATDRKDAVSGLDKAEDAAGDAEKACKKAEALAAQLRDAWLLPPAAPAADARVKSAPAASASQDAANK